jgi:Leucine-rich repeat (LRR) protein
MMESQELLELIERAAEEQWKELDLAGMNLTELPAEIGKLTQLEKLILGKWDEKTNKATDNYLTALPPEIGNLTNLTTLALSGNKIAEIPAEIGNLTNLITLHLGWNQITEIPAAIGNLTNLTTLNLSSNRIAEIPAAIGNLTNLIELYLRENKIAEISTEIFQGKGSANGTLTNLTILDLGGNQIKEISTEIGNLTNLIELYLGGNQIEEIPIEIGNLTNLTRLALSDNQITEIPEWFQSFKNLQRLDLRGNPIPILPEILRKNAERRDAGDPESRFAWRSRRREDSGEAGDIQAILSFYFQTQDPTATEPLYEAKFIIVGEGEAGKTTLAKKLKDLDYALKPDEKSTQGIDVIRWDFIQPNGKPFRVNIWDFGGQDIYHATHQFFLTARSLYTLLVDNRRENPNFYYWLNVVRLYSNDSPIFIVKNEKGDRNCELNERQLRSEFLQLKESLPTNLSTNRGLSEIQHFIQTHIANLPHIQIPIPKTWIKIRNVLENYAQHRNYISIEEYHALGKRNGVKDPQERLRISQYLHDLGICLHFQKDSTLKHRVILKPSWATNAVYKVTDTPIVIQNKGRCQLYRGSPSGSQSV